MNTQPNTATVNEILSYFVRNPQAADDLEGIAHWRLPSETIARSLDETQCALAWLVLNGYLCETHSLGAGPIYGLNRDRLKEAGEFLAAQVPASMARGN